MAAKAQKLKHRLIVYKSEAHWISKANNEALTTILKVYPLKKIAVRTGNITVNHQAATLLLVNQTQKEEIAKEDEFILQNWSYYGLKEKLEYKANKAGITIICE